jgi:hypothetical protein
LKAQRQAFLTSTAVPAAEDIVRHLHLVETGETGEAQLREQNPSHRAAWDRLWASTG